jgi:hypothetical protein
MWGTYSEFEYSRKKDNAQQPADSIHFTGMVSYTAHWHGRYSIRYEDLGDDVSRNFRLAGDQTDSQIAHSSAYNQK